MLYLGSVQSAIYNPNAIGNPSRDIFPLLKFPYAPSSPRSFFLEKLLVFPLGSQDQPSSPSFQALQSLGSCWRFGLLYRSLRL
ncbi:hypothetical protein RJT34_07392 [Clitoria ternatea]|uniref:Uncharacterized protein n=1 Tax=Clitoria ternatea TaxID=43366 RepID=A0AAN9PU00_CLITE